MKFYFVSFVVTLFVLIINAQTIVQGTCPKICNCTLDTSASDQCFICLQKQFKRNFIVQSNNCPCISGYVQNYPPTEFCCAKNCSLCYWQGCYQCRSNWTKTLNGAYYICVCKKNYIYDPILDDCICLGNYKEYGSLYYVPNRFECYICPQGCECHIWGCSICQPYTNRKNDIKAYNGYTCFCKQNYTEVDGVCQPIKNIIILTCDSSLILQNNICVCREPYYQDNQKNCICKSILDPTSYYLYQGICYRCPDMCKCNKFGCIFCSVIANRIIKQNHCTCINDTGIFQLNGNCICISPYNKYCQCNNYTYPSLFFTNQNGQCKKCPYGCQCDSNGCKSCNSKTNRNLSCYCQSPYIQLDGLCIACPQNFIQINNTCVCMARFLRDQYYYDTIQKKCLNCPRGCNCVGYQMPDINGCNFCDTNLNRVINLISDPSSTQKNYTCYCNTAKHFRQNSQYYCQCIPPYVLNQTNQCECKQPYYLNNSNICACKSQINPQAYYSYSDTDCRPCPIECNCSILGCYACSIKSGRAILIGSLSNYICPCFPIKSTIDQKFCKICKQKQYFWQNECIDCDFNCKTCNENGCLTCYQSMHLQNNTCLCSSNLYYNKGSCICQDGLFLKQSTCLACPLNCANCQYNDRVQNMVECISCNITAFRKNIINQQCPCIDYYVESNIKKPFCCHRNCKDCTITGCLSCIPFSYRQLNYTDKNNITCSCMSGFVQNYHIVCSCPPQTYRYRNRCQSCPSHCVQCQIVSQIISCTKCVDGFKRQNKINQISTNGINYTIFDCVCAGGYQQYINQSHCYPKSCQVISENGLCAICGPNRTQTRNVSYCNCTAGFYEDQSYTCQPCFEGCIKCISFDICEQCDINNNYQLVFNKQYMVINCIKPDSSLKIFYQEKDYIVLEIKGINNTNNQTYLSTKNLSIYLILLAENVSISTIKLNVLESKIVNTNILVIKFNNLTNDQLNPFLLYINSTNQTGFVYQRYYLMKDEVYTKTTINYSGFQVVFIQLFIIIIMIISLILNILGEKHNQLMYYCQTIYFIAMNVKDSHMYLVPFINFFRITIFNFAKQDSGSPFNSFISDWAVYFQKSYGNYRYFSVDNNLIRNVGLALYLAIQNLFFEIIFRIVYGILFRSKHKMFAQKYKKVVYRSLQWMQKVTMYPLMFFSLSTLILYQMQHSLVESSFRQLNKSIGIGILIFYTMSTFLQLLFEQISKIYRYELLLEYLFNITNSVIIITSVYNQYILFGLIPSMLLKSTLQYMKYRLFMYKPNTIYNYIIILKSVQCLMIIPIYFCTLIGTLTLILVYIFGILILRFQLIKKKHENANLMKKIGKIEQIEDNKESRAEQKFVDIENKSQEILQLNEFNKE